MTFQDVTISAGSGLRVRNAHDVHFVRSSIVVTKDPPLVLQRERAGRAACHRPTPANPTDRQRLAIDSLLSWVASADLKLKVPARVSEAHVLHELTEELLVVRKETFFHIVAKQVAEQPPKVLSAASMTKAAADR